MNPLSTGGDGYAQTLILLNLIAVNLFSPPFINPCHEDLQEWQVSESILLGVPDLSIPSKTKSENIRSNLLRGENVPSVARAQAVAKGMVDILKTKPAMLNDPNVNFTFSYAGDDSDAPVFGAIGRVWNKTLFGTFIDNFNKELSQYSGSNINTGVWHCSEALTGWSQTFFFSKHSKKIIAGIILLGIILTYLLNN